MDQQTIDRLRAEFPMFGTIQGTRYEPSHEELKLRAARKTPAMFMIAKWDFLEAHGLPGRVRHDQHLGWYYHTLGCTLKSGFKTEAAARKHMNNADADSVYWSAYHAGRCQ